MEYVGLCFFQVALRILIYEVNIYEWKIRRQEKTLLDYYSIGYDVSSTRSVLVDTWTSFSSLWICMPPSLFYAYFAWNSITKQKVSRLGIVILIIFHIFLVQHGYIYILMAYRREQCLLLKILSHLSSKIIFLSHVFSAIFDV